MYRTCKGAGEVTGHVHVLNQGAERAINEADTYECVSIFLVTQSSTHAHAQHVQHQPVLIQQQREEHKQHEQQNQHNQRQSTTINNNNNQQQPHNHTKTM